MLMLIMWSANGLSRTAKKKRGLVEDFFEKKSKSFRMLAQYVASEYTWAFQKIYKERTPRFFLKKSSQNRKNIATNSQHPIIGYMSKNERMLADTNLLKW
jgi:hypothetical protein